MKAVQQKYGNRIQVVAVNVYEGNRTAVDMFVDEGAAGFSPRGFTQSENIAHSERPLGRSRSWATKAPRHEGKK